MCNHFTVINAVCDTSTVTITFNGEKLKATPLRSVIKGIILHSSNIVLQALTRTMRQEKGHTNTKIISGFR